VRDGYADSTAVLVAWGEFPYRVARRTSDEPDVRAALVGRAHEAQEALACRRAWVVCESEVMGEVYSAITAQLRPQVAEATQTAWRRSPATSGADMVLSDGQPLPQVDVQRFVDLWCVALRYRFGWRRWVFVPVLLRPVLGAADEGGYLYQAARVAAGDVLYRDVFNINPPGSYWLMAGLFRLFGTTLATARAASAVVSGLTAALAYLV
jgi:hypothetical protein